MTTLYENEDFWEGRVGAKMKKVSNDKGEVKNAPQNGADRVNHPSHYTQGEVECIDAIRAALGPVGFQDYCRGNVIKYLWRWRQKGGLEDLEKSRVYQNWLIQSVEGMKNDAE